MPIGRPATPFPDIDFDRDDGDQQTHPRPPSNVRNYLDNSGVLITERIRRPSQISMIPVPTGSTSRRTSKDIQPMTNYHHNKPEALVADLSSSNGKNLKRLSLILKGDPNEILKPSKKSIHPNPSSSINSNRNSLDYSAASTSTPGLSSSSTSTPSSGSSSTTNGLGKLQQEQLLHLSKLKEIQRENEKNAQDLKGKESFGSYKNEKLYPLDRIRTFGIGYG